MIPLEETGPLAPGDGEASVILELGETWQAHAKAAYMQEGSLRQAEYTYVHPPVAGNELVQKRYEKRCVKIAMFRALCRLFPEAKLPWGSLTGIRPTRLLRELVEGEGPEEAKRIMQEEFDVSWTSCGCARRSTPPRPRCCGSRRPGIWTYTSASPFAPPGAFIAPF